MQMITEYLNHLETERKAKNTIDTYRYHLIRFLRWKEKEKISIDNITTKDLIKFKKELLHEGKSDRTINAIISCIRGFFDYLIIEDHVQSNPVVDALSMRVKSMIINPLTEEQIHIFNSHVNNLKVNIRAAFHLMMGTGARVGEVAALKKADFRLLEGKLLVNIVDAKWGSDRVIPVMLAESARIVNDYINSIEVYNQPAFRVSKRTLQTYADKFQAETGIQFHCHIVRHTFASKLLEKGVGIEKIQYLLGHKTVNMTRHYTQGANIDVKSLAPTIWQAGETIK